MIRRRSVEIAVDRGEDGIWCQIEIEIMARHRLRVVSDRSRGRMHQSGTGEDFEFAVDTQLRVWVRKFASDTPFRRDEDSAGVSMMVLEDVTYGIQHVVTLVSRPSDTRVQWVCTCNAGRRSWVEREVAERESAKHVEESTRREEAALDLADRRRAQRRAGELSAQEEEDHG